MKNRTPLILFVLFFINVLLQCNPKIPIFIDTQQKVFEKLALSFSQHFPKKADILIYDVNLLNGSLDLHKAIFDHMVAVLKLKQKQYDYLVHFESDIRQIIGDDDLSQLKKQDDLSLIAFGKNQKFDAVMLSSITIIDGITRRVWDMKMNAFVIKNIALFQGNVFDAENATSVLKFAYYFIL